MRIIVAGGSGFIGRYLIAALIADGHTVTVLTRAHPERRVTAGGVLRYVHWDPSATDSGLAEVLSGADAVINLAGANIGNRRWTKRRKADLLNSRVRATETLVRAIEFLEESRRPRTLVNGSGIDFYGDRGNEVLTEGSEPGDTFLAQVCERWEHGATAAQSLGVRVVLMRTAVVLAADAVTLHLMAWPFRLFLGGPIGDGQQWFPWIHIADLVDLYTWVLGTASIAGPVNAVAPEVCIQAQVAQALGTVLSRPQRLRTPVAALRLLMGEQADLLLHGRRAVPEQALAHGYARGSAAMVGRDFRLYWTVPGPQRDEGGCQIMSRDQAEKALTRFRPWLTAAAIYNLLWGSIIVIFPDALFRFLRMPSPSYLPLWQVVGMFVLVYAPAYGWAARRPDAHGHLILVGMLGKILGPIGFLWALALGQLPLRFGVVILTNDLLWWPAFACYLQVAARLHGGWKTFLLGD